MSSNWDWNNIGPDLTVGAATGISVGIVLLVAQAITESRKARADSHFAWESLKPKLAGAANRSWGSNLQDLTPAPPALIALDELTRGEPLSLWKKHFWRPDETLNLLIELVRQRAEYESAAANLESAMSAAMTAADKGLDAKAVSRIIRARAVGQSDAVALRSRNLTAAQSKTLISSADGWLAEPGMAFAMERYQTISNMFTDAITRFWGVLSDAGLNHTTTTT